MASHVRSMTVVCARCACVAGSLPPEWASMQTLAGLSLANNRISGMHASAELPHQCLARSSLPGPTITECMLTT